MASGITYQLRERKDLGSWGSWQTLQADSSSGGTLSKALSRTTGHYDFRIRSCSSVGCGNPSAFTSTTVKPPVPGAPVISGNEAPVDRDGNYTVSWLPADGADGYRLYENDVQIASPGGTSVDFMNNPSGTWNYKVAACLQGTCSEPGPVTTVEVSLIEDLEGVDGPAAMGSVTAVGSQPYTLDVSAGGDARIDVPLAAPPGVNGLTPRLGLAYSSGGPRRIIDAVRHAGILGYGWSLRGLSEIRRCRVGVGGDLDLGAPGSTGDVLCLDGQRLVNVSGGYWNAGSTYRTEINSFAQVVMHGSGANAWFEVFRPDGSVQSFGSAQNSRVIASGDSLPYLWSLAEHTDAFGNTLSVSYGIDAHYGSNYPLAIDYGGSRVEFSYEARTDSINLGYANAHHLALHAKRSVALSRIVFFADGGLVREYLLGNEMDPEDNYLRLEQVQACGYSEAGSAAACFAPLTFTWATHAGVPTEFVSVITALTDGDANTSEFVYSLLSGNSSHSLDYAEAPFGSVITPDSTQFLTTGRCSVQELRRPDGLGGTQVTTFAYKGSPHYSIAEGRGYVGFYETRRTEHDVPDTSGTFDRVTYTQQRLEFPFIGRVSQRLTLDGNFGSGNALGRREVLWSSQTQHSGTVTFPFAARTSDWFFEAGAEAGASQTLQAYTFSNNLIASVTRTRTTGTGLDSGTGGGTVWGDVPERSITGEVGSTTTNATLQNWTDWMNGDWRVGFVTNRTVTHAAPGQTPITTSVALTPFGSTQAIGSLTRMPGDSELALTVSHGYDNHGNLTDAVVSGNGFATRTTSLGSHLTDRYPESVTNAEGHTSTFAYDLRFGAVKTATDPNGLTTNASYDAFGRMVGLTDPEGNVTVRSHESCVTGCSQITWAQPVRRITETTHNGSTQVAPTVRIYLDARGREVLREQEAFAGTSGWIRSETHRDPYGRVVAESLPYFSNGGSPRYVTYARDRQGRVVTETRPDGGETTTAFALTGSDKDLEVNITEKVVTPGQSATYQTRRLVFDVQGRIKTAIDAFQSAEEAVTAYTYDAQHNLKTVTVNGAQVAAIDYDVLGRRTALSESNSGTTSFELDGLGQILSQIDAKLQETRFSHDRLGRITERIDGYGTSGAITSNWAWDGTAGDGRLRQRSNGQFTETLAYDSLGRISSTTTAISVPGISGLGPWTISHGYDNAGRPVSTTFPGNVTVSQGYNARGYLAEVSRGGTVLEAYQNVDAFGQVTQQSLHNGNMTTWRTTDPDSGRLTAIETQKNAGSERIQHLVMQWRSDGALYRRTDLQGPGSSDDTVETFTYDALNRVTQAVTTLGGGGTLRSLGFGYDTHGNLTTKTSSVSGDANVTGYGYASSGQPHRLTSATIAGVFTSFVYDANGNITRYQATGADDTWLDYNARNQVTRITVGSSAGTTSPTARDEFWYGPDGARFLKRETWTEDSTQQQSLTVYLLGGVYEEVHPISDGDTDWHRKIQATSAALIRVTRPAGQSTTETIEYLHRDHLGSVHKVTDAQGNVIHNLAFDPFGGRRESDWSSDVETATLEGILDALAENTGRGFTDHEHLDRTGFIHMNGRVYDPRIGRFVQPDPLVPDPTFSQDYNRYAYVRNRPLSLTDPTGYCAVDQSLEGGAHLGFGCSFKPIPFPSMPFSDPQPVWGGTGAGTSGFNWTDIEAAVQAYLAGLDSDSGSGSAPAPSVPFLDQFERPGQVADGPSGWQIGASIGVGMLPLVGSGQSIVELLTGWDYITGESVSRWLAAGGIIAGLAPGGKAVLKGAARGGLLFGQASVKSTFAHGPHAGRTIGEVAQGLRAGRISPDTLPIDFVVRNGQAIVLNNRSLLALQRAGMQPTVTRNLTGNQAAEALLNSHLRGGVPSNVIRVRGGPPGASLIE